MVDRGSLRLAATLLVVGATGDVGSGCARCLAPHVKRLLLYARNGERLRRLETEPIAGPDQLEIEVLQDGGIPSADESTLATPSGGRSKGRRTAKTPQRRGHASHT